MPLVVQGLRIYLLITGDLSSIPGQGTKIPHSSGQLCPQATTRESLCQDEDLVQPK